MPAWYNVHSRGRHSSSGCHTRRYDFPTWHLQADGPLAKGREGPSGG